MSLSAILLIIIILMLVGVVPIWPHRRYGPNGGLGLILVLLEKI